MGQSLRWFNDDEIQRLDAMLEWFENHRTHPLPQQHRRQLPGRHVTQAKIGKLAFDSTKNSTDPNAVVTWGYSSNQPPAELSGASSSGDFSAYDWSDFGGKQGTPVVCLKNTDSDPSRWLYLPASEQQYVQWGKAVGNWHKRSGAPGSMAYVHVWPLYGSVTPTTDHVVKVNYRNLALSDPNVIADDYVAYVHDYNDVAHAIYPELDAGIGALRIYSGLPDLDTGRGWAQANGTANASTNGGTGKDYSGNALVGAVGVPSTGTYDPGDLVHDGGAGSTYDPDTLATHTAYFYERLNNSSSS